MNIPSKSIPFNSQVPLKSTRKSTRPNRGTYGRFDMSALAGFGGSEEQSIWIDDIDCQGRRENVEGCGGRFCFFKIMDGWDTPNGGKTHEVETLNV